MKYLLRKARFKNKANKRGISQLIVTATLIGLLGE